MKKVLLLGDSIRMNYQEYVKEQLSGKAKVLYPKYNGEFCLRTLRYVHEWMDALSDGKNDFDIIHFNCGLWDVLRLSNEDNTFTDANIYGELLIRIYERIKHFCPNAIYIYALTTPVIEPGFAPGLAYGERKNADIELFNQIAVDTFSKINVEINDLWSVASSLGVEAYSDDVHFDTDLGIRSLGNKVIETISKHLDE